MALEHQLVYFFVADIAKPGEAGRRETSRAQGQNKHECEQQETRDFIRRLDGQGFGDILAMRDGRRPKPYLTPNAHHD